MKKLFLTCLASLFAAGPLLAAPELLLRERCHKGECNFTRIIQTKTIGKNDDGYMLEVKARSATKRIPAGILEADLQPPENYGLVRVVYLFCSKKKPALIFSDRKFYAHLLNIGETPPGNEIDSHIEYWAGCHDRTVSVADVTGGKLAKDAADLGYQKWPDGTPGQREFRNGKKAFRFFGL